MFHVIRVSSSYKMVVVCCSERQEPRPEDPSNTYFIYNNLTDEDFEESSYRGVLGYFSGIADGMGFGELPKEPFSSLDDVRRWREERALKSDIDSLDSLIADESFSKNLRKKAAIELAELHRKLLALSKKV